MVLRALGWVGGADGYLELIDQRRLPAELVKLKCERAEQVYEAIQTLAVRGAPAIGVAAGYGCVLGLQKLTAGAGPEQGLSVLTKTCEYLGSARPTAVNLFWALDRMRRGAAAFVAGEVDELQEIVLAEAHAICKEDEDMCRRIGENGERFVKDGCGVLTHCNAGALATAGEGTALAVLYEAKKKGKDFSVYADETRPLLQGARLTAWELTQARIETTVICDSAAATLMKQGKIDIVITGADRIAANGDTANKIGTYSLSILAKEHGIPFYIAAPSSTFDLSISSGKEIPIEQRSEREVRFCADRQIVPKAAAVYNPAFDVTPAGNAGPASHVCAKLSPDHSMLR